MPECPYCPPEGCNRPHYAKGMCERGYRLHKGYNTQYNAEVIGTERLREYRNRYEATHGGDRQRRYSKVRDALGKVLGVHRPQLKLVFSSESMLQQLAEAMEQANPLLLEVWSLLQPEQQDAIKATAQKSKGK